METKKDDIIAAQEKIAERIIEQLNGLSYVEASLILERAYNKIGSVAKITRSEVAPEQSDKH